MARHLQAGNLTPAAVPTSKQEEIRQLVRNQPADISLIDRL